MFHQGPLMNSLLVRLFITVVKYAVGTIFIEVLTFHSEIGLFRVKQSKRVKTSLWKS